MAEFGSHVMLVSVPYHANKQQTSHSSMQSPFNSLQLQLFSHLQALLPSQASTHQIQTLQAGHFAQNINHMFNTLRTNVVVCLQGVTCQTNKA
jgi:hypothetical protein